MSTTLTSQNPKRGILPARPTVPVEKDNRRFEKSRNRPVDLAKAQVSSQQFDDVEVVLNTKTFWIQKDKLAIRTYESPTVIYKISGDTEWFEVKDWDFKVDATSSGWSSLPDQLARHFFEYFCRAQENGLSEKEQLTFARICRQVDYRTFCAEFDPTRYMECTLVHKYPQPRLLSSSGTVYKLASSLIESLHVLNEGDYFGAEFTFSPNGVISKIDSPRLLTKPDTFEIDQLLPKRR